jgi:hypothetical protein
LANTGVGVNGFGKSLFAESVWAAARGSSRSLEARVHDWDE